MRTNEEIIVLIKQLQNKKGLSLSELARRTNVAKSTLSRYLSGSREFPLNLADKFASVLDVTTPFLLGMENDSSEKQTVELDDDSVIMTFDGKPIPDEDRELIKRLLRGK